MFFERLIAKWITALYTFLLYQQFWFKQIVYQK